MNGIFLKGKMPWEVSYSFLLYPCEELMIDNCLLTKSDRGNDAV
jgi:hypothetical protein